MSNSPDHVEAARTRQTISIARTGMMTGAAVTAVNGMRNQGVIVVGQASFFPFSFC